MEAASITPLEYLNLADRKYAAGEHIEASLLMWKATEAVFVELADSHGLDYTEDYISLAKALENESSVAKFNYSGALTTGNVLSDHAEMGVLEISELDLAYETARKFILRSCSDK